MDNYNLLTPENYISFHSELIRTNIEGRVDNKKIDLIVKRIKNESIKNRCWWPIVIGSDNLKYSMMGYKWNGKRWLFVKLT